MPFPLRIVSWNVLAEDFFRTYAAHYPGVALDAETRRARVVAEVVRLAAEADVIVLQEVDAVLDAVPLPNGPIPSPAHPSDHLPLRATLAIGR